MGLAVAHSERPPIIHRDVKPQNILVGYDSNGLRIRVSDFGLAKKLNPLTMLASARGTPAFKPPEARTNVDSCTGDVWALGVTFYLLLTDRLPFPIKSEEDFVTGKCWKQPFNQISYYNIQVDPLIDSIISRALSLKPSDRYHDAKQMLADLQKWKPRDKYVSDRHNVDSNKSALGSFQQAKKTSIQTMIDEAIKLSHNVGNLMEAADLLEEALNRYPEFRGQYEYQLKLWRRGIIM
jgi:serine/threonine-protein kinase